MKYCQAMFHRASLRLALLYSFFVQANSIEDEAVYFLVFSRIMCCLICSTSSSIFFFYPVMLRCALSIKQKALSVNRHYAFHDFLELAVKCRNVICDGFPKQILVHGFIFMREKVSHATHF